MVITNVTWLLRAAMLPRVGYDAYTKKNEKIDNGGFKMDAKPIVKIFVYSFIDEAEKIDTCI